MLLKLDDCGDRFVLTAAQQGCGWSPTPADTPGASDLCIGGVTMQPPGSSVETRYEQRLKKG
jgi:hypothetical protein